MIVRVSALALSLLGLVVGCGDVGSGVCSGEESDNIECTVDFCDTNAAAYTHLADDSRCEAGQRCSTTMGCVTSAIGDLSGVAKLVGKADSSGITVSAMGSTVTATTAADGSWKLTGLPAGIYTIGFTKAKYVSQQVANLSVVTDAVQGAPDVKLSHAEEWGASRTITSVSQVYFSPDRNTMVEITQTSFGAIAYASPMDGSAQPVALANVSQAIVTNTHLIWTVSNSAVWARPLDGSKPGYRLGTAAPGGGNISVAGTPGTYTVISKNRYTGTYQEYSLWTARTDGSVAPPATAAWTSVDGSHSLGPVAVNNTTALFGVNDPGTTTPLHRLDLATNVDTLVSVGVSTMSVGFNSIAPDFSAVYGYAYYQGESGFWYHYHGFVAPITGATPSSPVAVSSAGTQPPAGCCYTWYSDYGSTYGWLPDNSGVVLRNNDYYYGGATNAGGELKTFFKGQASATVLAPRDVFGTPTIVGTVGIFQHPTSKVISAVSLDKTSPVTVVLDSTGQGMLQSWNKLVSATNAYFVWFEGPGGQPQKVYAANMTLPFTTVTPVQLGSNVSPSCLFEGAMSNTTFYQLCADSGLLTSYTKNTSAPAGQQTGVLAGMLPLPASDRIGFLKSDGMLYSASNDGTFGASVKQLSGKIDNNLTSVNLGSWLVFRDTSSLLTRVSNTDGSVIDEPIFECDSFATTGNFLPTLDNSSQHLWFPNAKCGTLTKQIHEPVANLP